MRTSILTLVVVLGACSGRLMIQREKVNPGTPGVSRQISFTTTEGTKLSFDLSPDGRWIVFDLLGQLWRVPTEGGQATPLTDAVGAMSEDLDPAISPDGRRIVFQSDRPGGRALWIMPAEGGSAARLTSRTITFFAYAGAAWAPDGRHIAYAVRDTLAILDVEAGTERVLHIDSLPPAAPVAPWIARTGSPAWSPDGTQIAFVNGGGDGRIWEVAAEGGMARPIGGVTERGLGPSYSPDGAHLAYFATDSAGRQQLWVRDLRSRASRRLTNHDEVIPIRARWAPDGKYLYYSADGGLWRVPLTGDLPSRISFTAQVSFVRAEFRPAAVRFPAPGSQRTARAFAAVALSPDGARLAMIALDSLRVGNVGGPLRSLSPVHVPERPSLSWSPDGREVVWVESLADTVARIIATDTHTGATRPLTTFGGAPEYPRWSPDGRHIAFLLAGRLRVMPAAAPTVVRASDARDLGPVSVAWGNLAWSAGSDALVASELLLSSGEQRSEAWWIPLEGERRAIARFPRSPANLHLTAHGRAVYVESNLIWSAPWRDGHGITDSATAVSSDPAIEARYASDGSILYLSSNGMRVRRADGTAHDVDWPLRYRVPDAPAPLLVRGARVIDATGAPASEPSDVLIAGGRIARVAPAGTIPTPSGGTVLDAGGRFVIPGLVDLHAHVWRGGYLAAYLHNGVTTIRDIASQNPQTGDRRNAIEAGMRPGPRMVYAGPMFSGGDVGYSTLQDQFVSDSGAVARAMSILSHLGVQYVKDRSFTHWWGVANVAREAHRYGIPVSGHCEHILPVVAAGVDGQEHTRDCFRDWSEVRSDYVSLTKTAGMWLVPTAALVRTSQLRVLDDPALLERPEVAPFMDAFTARFVRTDSAARRSRPALERSYQRLVQGTRAYHEAGVPMGVGTDNPFPLSVQHEMEVLVAAGHTPLQALMAATSNAARIIGSDEEIGTVEAGKWADLVVLEANPLDDIRNASRIWQVIQGGRIVDREALRRQPEPRTAKR